MLMITATLGAWTLLVLAVTWALGAVGWYLLARLWWRELFVPGAVFSTVLAVLIATLWAVFLWWWALLWSRYHYYRYFRRNKRQLAPPALRAQRLLWQESLLSPPCPSVSATRARSTFMPLKRHASVVSLFSRAAQLAEKEDLIRAVGLLRQVLAAEDAPPLLRVAALLRLGKLLSRMGEERLAKSFFFLAQTERRKLS
ncbi:MAG: hypothetical protein QME76_11450 [Bacillota bacterium]|nr:hypothetical protein [Bacillota bacterium]